MARKKTTARIPVTELTERWFELNNQLIGMGIYQTGLEINLHLPEKQTREIKRHIEHSQKVSVGFVEQVSK